MHCSIYLACSSFAVAMICKTQPVPIVLFSQKWQLRETAVRNWQDRFKPQSVKYQDWCVVFHYTTLHLFVAVFFRERIL